MGRNAQPISLLEATGKKHLTKEEKEQRRKSEIKFGSQRLVCPDFVKANPVAFRKWKELAALYAGLDLVASGDVGMLARYCITYSEYLDLVSRRERIDSISKDCDDVEDYLEENDADFNWRVRKKLMDMCSTGAVLAIDTAINKKMEMLIKMEDRLFLNPLAKIKNVLPEPKEAPKDPMERAGFGDV